MDGFGKIIWVRYNEVVFVVIKVGDVIKDNELIIFFIKELGNVEIYFQVLFYLFNGCFVVICGDGEYIIYIVLVWCNKVFGLVFDFVWVFKENLNDFVICELLISIKVFKNFQEKKGGFDVLFVVDGFIGGVLFGVKGQGGILFFDW